MPYLTFVLVALTAAGANQPSVPDRLQGAWSGQSRVYQGRIEPRDALKGLKLVIEGRRFVYYGTDGKQLRGELVFPAQSGEVDTVVIADDGRRTVVPSLYRLDGDVLEVARPQGSDAKRPIDFASPPGSKVRVTVYRRQP